MNVAHWLTCFAAAIASSTAEAQIQRPNVVLIVADPLRYESCGFADDVQAITPHIDRLANTGISFDNYVVNTPVSAATQATFWTGKYASSHGMVDNRLRLNPNHDTLGHLLTAKRYVCDFIGTWHLWANPSVSRHLTQNAFCPPGPYRLGFDGFWAAYNFDHENHRAFCFPDTREPHDVDGWWPSQATDMAITRIAHHAAAKQPFALVVSYSPPRGLWTRDDVPPSWYKRYADIEFQLPITWSDTPDGTRDRHADPQQLLAKWKPDLPQHMRVGYAITAALDEQIGRLLQALDDNQLENTIVILTSDHGEQLGANARVFQTTFFDKSTRVPLLIRWVGRIPAGRRSNACISAVDVMPTICGMLGIGFPDSTDGIDLSDSTRVDCSCEPDFAFLQGIGHTVPGVDGFEWRAIRDQRFTYARYLVDGDEFLFDNRDDPEQSQNLVHDSQFSDDLGRLRQWLAEKLLATRDEFRPSTWYRDNWTENGVIIRGAHGEFHRETGADFPVDVPFNSVDP